MKFWIWFDWWVYVIFSQNHDRKHARIKPINVIYSYARESCMQNIYTCLFLHSHGKTNKPVNVRERNISTNLFYYSSYWSCCIHLVDYYMNLVDYCLDLVDCLASEVDHIIFAVPVARTHFDMMIPHSVLYGCNINWIKVNLNTKLVNYFGILDVHLSWHCLESHSRPISILKRQRNKW